MSISTPEGRWRPLLVAEAVGRSPGRIRSSRQLISGGDAEVESVGAD